MRRVPENIARLEARDSEQSEPEEFLTRRDPVIYEPVGSQLAMPVRSFAVQARAETMFAPSVGFVREFAVALATAAVTTVFVSAVGFAWVWRLSEAFPDTGLEDDTDDSTTDNEVVPTVESVATSGATGDLS